MFSELARAALEEAEERLLEAVVEFESIDQDLAERFRQTRLKVTAALSFDLRMLP